MIYLEPGILLSCFSFLCSDPILFHLWYDLTTSPNSCRYCDNNWKFFNARTLSTPVSVQIVLVQQRGILRLICRDWKNLIDSFVKVYHLNWPPVEEVARRNILSELISRFQRLELMIISLINPTQFFLPNIDEVKPLSAGKCPLVLKTVVPVQSFQLLLHYVNHYCFLTEFDVSGSLAFDDKALSALFDVYKKTSIRPLEILRCNRCPRIEYPFLDWDEDNFPFQSLKVYMDGCFRITPYLVYPHLNKHLPNLWLDLLHGHPLNVDQELEVVIISEPYVSVLLGCWVKCKVTKLVENSRVEMYDIFVLETTAYGNAIGFSNRPATNIERHYLRHSCARVINN